MSAPVFDGETRGRWYPYEDEIVRRTDITVVEMCYMLNRSYGSVMGRRRLLRPKTKPAVQQQDRRAMLQVVQAVLQNRRGSNPKGQFYGSTVQQVAARMLPELIERTRGTGDGMLVDRLATKHRLSKIEAQLLIDLSRIHGVAPMEGEME